MANENRLKMRNKSLEYAIADRRAATRWCTTFDGTGLRGLPTEASSEPCEGERTRRANRSRERSERWETVDNLR
jgi:hypothetical protein